MKKWLITLGTLMLFSALSAMGADFNGILVDRACGGEHVKEGQAWAKTHSRECGLMDPCVKSGYAIFTADGKYLTLDAQGNKKAEEALRKSDKKDDIEVKVSGEQDGDTLKVTSLTIE